MQANDQPTPLKKNGKTKHSYKQKYECLMDWRVQQKIFPKVKVDSKPKVA